MRRSSWSRRAAGICEEAYGRSKDAGIRQAGWLSFTTDYDQAQAFFEGKLAFEFVSLDAYALVMRIGGHSIRIVKMADFKPARATVLGWEVADIEAAVKWLQERGVSTEKYPFAQDQATGIWTAPTGDKIAWFKDPDGNVLSVSQHVRS